MKCNQGRFAKDAHERVEGYSRSGQGARPPSPRLRRASSDGPRRPPPDTRRHASERRREVREADRERAARAGREGPPPERSEYWRRRDSHPRPKIHPRRNLRCVSASEISPPSSRSSEESPGASPGKSRRRRPEQRVGSQPAELTSVSGPQADRKGRSQCLRLRERAACPQLGCFHLFYEGDGPRHASCETISPSNLIRPHRARQTFHCTASARTRQTVVGLGVASLCILDLSGNAPDNA